MTRRIEILDYDSTWPQTFRRLAHSLQKELEGFIIGIEHVGSTSIPGLAAKSVIDLDIIISSRVVFPSVKERLETLHYKHEGNRTIPGREAFASPQGNPPHHLYVCSVNTPNLHNHLLFRDYLRLHPELAAEYGRLKQELAARHPHDIDAYVQGKTEFIEYILTRAASEYGFDQFQPPA